MIAKLRALLVSFWQTLTLPPLAPVPVRSDDERHQASRRNCHRSINEDSEF